MTATAPSIRPQRPGRPGHRRQPRAGPRDGPRLRRGAVPTSSSPAATATACEEFAAEVTEATGVGRWASARTSAAGTRSTGWWTGCTTSSARSTSWSTTPACPRSTTPSPTCPRSCSTRCIGVNLKGPFRLMALVGTRMAAGNGGSIINISSVGAVRPRPAILPYAAAKAGLNALTVGFAHAFGPTVRVNAIMAGTFLTDVSKAWDMEAFAKRARGVRGQARRGARGDRRRGALPGQRPVQLHDRLDPHRRRRPALEPRTAVSAPPEGCRNRHAGRRSELGCRDLARTAPCRPRRAR